MRDPSAVPAAVRRRAESLVTPTPMRRGSLTARAMKCGQTRCACATDVAHRHGPYWTLTRATGGRTRSRYLAPAQAPLAERQLEAGRHFREQLEAYWQACETWADAELAGVALSPEGAEKRGSRRRSPRRSAPKSPRS